VSLFNSKLSEINHINQLAEVSTGQPIDDNALKQMLNSKKIVLIGEKHDHPYHHKIQAQILSLIDPDRIEGIWFEHFDRTQQKALGELRLDPAALEELRKKVAWDKSGWPSWAIYQPLFRQVLAYQKPLFAANLDRAAISSVMKIGYEIVFTIDDVESLKLKQALPDGNQAKLTAHIEKVHCHKMSDNLKRQMLRAQRAKDAYMAKTLTSNGSETKVLIAGNGHVRNDWGVPFYLKALGYKKDEILSIGIIEGVWKKGELSSKMYPYDLVFFTDVHDQRDPCQVYKKSLEKLHKKN
jgi:uncharacterized iron-regulated protein